MAINPKKSPVFSANKPEFALRSHATLRTHGKGKRQRFEIGFRIPPDMEEHLYKLLSAKRAKQSKS
jgi:hypothetical protein